MDPLPPKHRTVVTGATARRKLRASDCPRYDLSMRLAALWKILAGGSLLAAAVLGFLSDRAFRSALAARLDRAEEIEAAAARPAAAARLASALAEHRLSLVTESESQAVSAAFRRQAGGDALEGYRRTRGSDAVIREAETALAAKRPPDDESEVAFLRAIRALREEAARAPVPRPIASPASAGEARRWLLWAGAAALAACLFAYAAGRSG